MAGGPTDEEGRFSAEFWAGVTLASEVWRLPLHERISYVAHTLRGCVFGCRLGPADPEEIPPAERADHDGKPQLCSPNRGIGR